MAKSGLRLMDRDLENSRGSSVHLVILLSKHHQTIGEGGFGGVPEGRDDFRLPDDPGQIFNCTYEGINDTFDSVWTTTGSVLVCTG